MIGHVNFRASLTCKSSVNRITRSTRNTRTARMGTNREMSRIPTPAAPHQMLAASEANQSNPNPARVRIPFWTGTATIRIRRTRTCARLAHAHMRTRARMRRMVSGQFSPSTRLQLAIFLSMFVFCSLEHAVVNWLQRQTRYYILKI